MFTRFLLALGLALAITGCRAPAEAENEAVATPASAPASATATAPCCTPTVEAENERAGNDAGSAQVYSVSADLIGRAELNAKSPAGAAEIVAFQNSTGSIYAINNAGDSSTVEILATGDLDREQLAADGEGVFTNTNLESSTVIELADNTRGGANSIAVDDHNELLAVAIAADAVDEEGAVAFYDIGGGDPLFIKNVQVGFLPDMVTFSPDGRKVVVANEGQPSGDYLIDPEGSVTIIDIVDGAPEDEGTQLALTQFDGLEEALEAQGVRFAHPETGAITVDGVGNVASSVAQDLEPEYVAISEDSSRAYITLQENNAILVVDLEAEAVIDLFGLGFKDWGQYQLDGSDKDGLNFASYPNLYGMFQPDSVATFQVEGTNYIVTANEGDGREYFFDVADEAACDAAIDKDVAETTDYSKKNGCLSYTDEVRVKDLTLDANAFPGINANENIGRLIVSIEYGDTDGDGDYDELYTYGARSFSIFSEDGALVFDSGDDFGKRTAEIHGEAFNNNGDENKGDTRSDAKGAEPETVVVGDVDGHLLAFVGLERMGGVFVYDVTDPHAAHAVGYFYNRGLVDGQKISGDLAPEGLKFVHADNSPTGEALLIVGNEISGSVAVWEISTE